MLRRPLLYINVASMRPGTPGGYTLALVSVVVATLLRLAVDPFVIGVPFLTFWPALIITALTSGFRAGLLCVVLSTAAAVFFVIEPHLSFYIEHRADVAHLLLFVSLASFSVIVIAEMRNAIEREQAERALRESKERLQLALDTAQLGWWQYDPRRLVGSGDARFKEIFDLTTDELPTKEIRELVHPDDAERFWEDRSTMLDPNGPQRSTHEYRVQRRDGEVRWVRVCRLASREGAGRERRVASLVGTVQDITEHKECAEREHFFKDRLQSVLDAAKLGSWQYDPLHRVFSWDARGKEILAVAENGATVEKFMSWVHPDDAEKVWAAFWTALDPAQSKRSPTQFRLRRGDGEVRWVETQELAHLEGAGHEQRVVSFIGTAADITERKHSEELVQRQADLLNQSQDAILTWKIGGGIAYWSRGAERLYEYTAEEAIGRSSHELLRTRSPIPMQEIERQIAREGSWYGELTQTTRGGRTIVVESRHVRVSYDGETIALETNRDITDRKRAEDALRDSEERLRAIYDGTYEYIGLLSPDGTMLEANRASLEFAGDTFGSKREHVVGRPFGEAVWFAHTPGAPEKLREAIARAAAGEFIRYEAPLMRPSGEEVIFDFSLHPVRNNQGDVSLIVPEGRIITDRKRAEEELAKSEERFRTSILHSPVPTALYDDREQILAISESWLKAAGGVSADDFPRIKDWTNYLFDGGKRSREALELMREIIATEPEARKDELMLNFGERIWNFVTSGLGALSDGRRLFVTVAQDVTDRRNYEERIELLMRESHHRIKNILGLVQVIARQTGAGEAQNFIDRFNKRIQALAANQDLLVRHEWQRIDVKDLVQSQLGHFADLIGTRINFDGPKLLLSAAAAQAIGLAIHELATNAGKYGALSVNMGRLDISWGVDSDTFTMSWAERNGPPASPPKRRGFGTIVMEATAERSVDGKVDLDYAPSGLTWRLTCPVAKVLESNWDTGSRGPPPFRPAL
jgi:PAS domain S-box-containing protein